MLPYDKEQDYPLWAVILCNKYDKPILMDFYETLSEANQAKADYGIRSEDGVNPYNDGDDVKIIRCELYTDGSLAMNF